MIIYNEKYFVLLVIITMNKRLAIPSHVISYQAVREFNKENTQYGSLKRDELSQVVGRSKIRNFLQCNWKKCLIQQFHFQEFSQYR